MQRASVLQLKIARKLCYSFSVALTLVLLSFCLMACGLASECGATVLNSACHTNKVQHYEELVVVDGGAYRKAYNLLSADLQASEPYNDFIKNANYTLKKGCWTIGAIHVSQRNSLTWDVGVELTQVSCVDITPIAYYDWRFQVQKQYGLFVITSLGLYPTGSQNQ